MENFADSRIAPVSQGPRTVFGKAVLPWEDEEIEILKKIAPRSTTKKELAALFPKRGHRSVSCKLTAIRHELGLLRSQQPTLNLVHQSRVTVLDPDDKGVNDSELSRRRRLAAIASAQMLEALGAQRYG